MVHCTHATILGARINITIIEGNSSVQCLLENYLQCLHSNTVTFLHTVATTKYINPKLLEITLLIMSLNETLLRELSAKITKYKLTPDGIFPHYYWLIGALIVMGAVQLAFSVACFILGLRLNLKKSKNRAQRKGSTNTICSRLEEAAGPSSRTATPRRPQRTQDRESRRLSSRIMRRLDPIRHNSTLIAFLSTPPNYRAPAPPPPQESAAGYQNVKYHHQKTHN